MQGFEGLALGTSFIRAKFSTLRYMVLAICFVLVSCLDRFIDKLQALQNLLPVFLTLSSNNGVEDKDQIVSLCKMRPHDHSSLKAYAPLFVIWNRPLVGLLGQGRLLIINLTTYTHRPGDLCQVKAYHWS